MRKLDSNPRRQAANEGQHVDWNVCVDYALGCSVGFSSLRAKQGYDGGGFCGHYFLCPSAAVLHKESIWGHFLDRSHRVALCFGYRRVSLNMISRRTAGTRTVSSAAEILSSMSCACGKTQITTAYLSRLSYQNLGWQSWTLNTNNRNGLINTVTSSAIAQRSKTTKTRNWDVGRGTYS